MRTGPLGNPVSGSASLEIKMLSPPKRTMPTTLTVRNVPAALHARLKRRAKEHRRSLNSEVLTLLEEAVGEEEADREGLMGRIKQRRATLPPLPWGPEELKKYVREDLA